MRKPYQTLTTARAAVYLRDCERLGREPNISEMARRGIGADRKSARRALERARMLREFAPCTAA